ncbi:MAG: UDP-3-O-[3-hydroxymyristoyl] N-acetylglucosamine deacetylase [Pirellulales bacterium]|nr:UDP-3-O-[3-hydroxymyristoyl] N-acetylglucosamine deacetylase [Pirellulales bacterium]
MTKTRVSCNQRNQRTLAGVAVVEGYGYWTGRDVKVEFRPAAPDTGVVFVRSDLTPTVQLPAAVEHRVEVPRRTVLRRGSASVEMVEHVLAALAGLQIDNCEVWVDRPELPGLDGSAKALVEALDTVGVVVQHATRSQLIVREITRLGDDESWIEVRPAQTDGLSVRYRVDYGADSSIGRQTLQVSITPETFRRDLAPARTFMLKEEAEWLQAQGFGKRAKLTDLLVFDADGPIENELRYRDECARHKILDLVGDFALAGCDVVGQVIAHRSGHRLNAEMVRVLLSEGEKVVGRRRAG